jgi:Ca2+-binding RTX toxin-like protein
VIGSNSGDTLTGDIKANGFWGLAGDDTLIGGIGGDVLKGGAGNDTFVYTSIADSTVAAAGKDTIGDFTTGDKIDLSAIDADTAFIFSTAPGPFSGTHGELKVLAAGGGVYLVYADINGDKTADFAINVHSDHALTAADFVL